MFLIARNRQIAAELRRRTALHIARNQLIEMRSAAPPGHQRVVRHRYDAADNRCRKHCRAGNVSGFIRMFSKHHKQDAAHGKIHENRHQRMQQTFAYRAPHFSRFFFEIRHFFHILLCKNFYPIRAPTRVLVLCCFSETRPAGEPAFFRRKR